MSHGIILLFSLIHSFKIFSKCVLCQVLYLNTMSGVQILELQMKMMQPLPSDILQCRTTKCRWITDEGVRQNRKMVSTCLQLWKWKWLRWSQSGSPLHCRCVHSRAIWLGLVESFCIFPPKPLHLAWKSHYIFLSLTSLFFWMNRECVATKTKLVKWSADPKMAHFLLKLLQFWQSTFPIFL